MAMNTLISAVKAYVAGAVAKLPSHEDLRSIEENTEKAYAKKGSLSRVATSGSYEDLADLPDLFSGSYNDLTNKPTLATVAKSGAYNDLTDTPCRKVVTDSTYVTWSLTSLSIVDPTSGGVRWPGESWSSSDYAKYKGATVAIKLAASSAPNATVFADTDYMPSRGRGGYSNWEFWGNGSLFDSSLEDTGETWCVLIKSSGIAAYSTEGTPGCALLSVRTTEYETLEEALLPDTVATKSYVEELLGVIENGSY